MSFPAAAKRLVRAFRHRDYAIYFAGNTITLIGLWMQRIAVGWVAWELTESATWLGIVAFADLFPVMVISPLAGTIADRVNRLTIATVTQSIAMVQAATLAVLSFTGMLDIWGLFGLALLGGVVMSFWQPARLSLVPSLVPKEDLPSAVSVNAVLFNGARFIGPALAGLLILNASAGWVFLANAVSYVSFLIALQFVRRDAGAPAMKGRDSIGTAMAEGYRYAFGHQGIGPLLLLMCVTCICMRPVFELLPGFASEVFGRGAEGLSTLASATGIGAVIGGLWVGQRASGTNGLTDAVFGSAGLMTLSLLLFTATDIYAVGILAVGLAGAGMVANGAATQTLIQGAVEDHMRGRVMALYGMLFRGCPAIGAVAMGVASEVLGLRLPLAIGCGLALAILLYMIARRRLMTQVLEGSANVADEAAQPAKAPGD